MLDLKSLEKYDSQKMYKIYEKWPEIAKEQYDHNFPKIDFQNISNVIFAGMGGSGTIGDIFSSILSKTDIHVNVVKGPFLLTGHKSQPAMYIFILTTSTSPSVENEQTGCIHTQLVMLHISQ